MKNKKLLVSVFLLILVSTFFITGCEKVPAGYVGVKVYLLGSSKGVDSEELGVGRYWVGINEELYLYPTFTKTYVWTADYQEDSETNESIDIQTKEGLTVNADVGIQFRVEPEKANVLFQTYRRGIDEITDSVLRTAVRDVLNRLASSMTSDMIYGQGRVELIEKSTEAVKQEFAAKGIIVERLYWIGTMRLPDKVKQALDAKIEQIQKAEQRENELREAVAQAKIEKAKAEGTANQIRLESQQLTPLMIQKMWIEKWDGKLPQQMLGDKSTILVPFNK
ncbi:SPFH domain-containing protein [Leptospira ilyithenensis]|uniref:Prohibitin family protein n=1 Tax=Leptospira ilyithenensis TaxID=2484901 RepID=A0A4R9LN40_9LEPT|nr:SPFH domain-containing protein [Leptospira ilyithenensis]TGN08293.1 prohibitin family protein [Leptospira ilyithenensis]